MVDFIPRKINVYIFPSLSPFLLPPPPHHTHISPLVLYRLRRPHYFIMLEDYHYIYILVHSVKQIGLFTKK